MKGSPTGRFTENLQDVAGDIADLCELQAELFGKDARATAKRIVLPVVLAIVGAVVLATSALLAFSALAFWLSAEFALSLGFAYLLAALGALVFGVLCVGASWILLRWSEIPLSRSWKQLKLNLVWVRRALFGPSKRAA